MDEWTNQDARSPWPWMNVISLFDTKLPADTVQAVPSLPGRDGETHLITVGTYLYDPETKVRSGHLELRTLSSDMKGLY